MARYIIVNRRAGLFTQEAKIASRESVDSALAEISDAKIISDRQPKDRLARRVVVFDAAPGRIARVASKLPRSVVIEPLVRRKLHQHLRPMIMRNSIPLNVSAVRTGKAGYVIKISAGGKPLGDIQVLFYLVTSSGQMTTNSLNTDASGKVAINPPAGYQISMVEPIPFDSYWIMLEESPATGSSSLDYKITWHLFSLLVEVLVLRNSPATRLIGNIAPADFLRHLNAKCPVEGLSNCCFSKVQPQGPRRPLDWP